jgi:hypothetical protein
MRRRRTLSKISLRLLRRWHRVYYLQAPTCQLLPLLPMAQRSILLHPLRQLPMTQLHGQRPGLERPCSPRRRAPGKPVCFAQAPGASKPRPGAADATLPAAVLAQALKQSAPIRFPVIPSCTGSRPGAMMKRLLAASARPGADDATLLQQQGARPLACATMDNGQDARQYN